MLDSKLISENIIYLRQQKGMTQQELAACVNVTHQAVSKWENGSSIPDLQTLIELRRLFGVTMDELLTESLRARVSPALADPHPAERLVDDQSGTMGGTNSPDAPEEPEEPERPEEPEEPERPEGPELPEEAGEPEEEPLIDIARLPALAPFLSKEKLRDMILRQIDRVQPNQLNSLAPFLGRKMLDEILDRMDIQNIRPGQLTGLAPFLSRDTLDKLMARMDVQSIPVGQLTGLAPFLSHDTLDKLMARMDVQSIPVGQLTGLAPFLSQDTLGRLIDRMGKLSFSQLLALAPFLPRDTINAQMGSHPGRHGDKRRNGDNVSSDDMEQAIDNQDWGFIEDHLSALRDPDQIRRAALAAAEDGFFDFMASLPLDQQTLEAVALAGAQAGAFDDVLEFVSLAKLSADTQREIVRLALEAGETDELIDQARRLPADLRTEIAMHLAKSGEFDELDELVPMLDVTALAQIIDMAAESGELDFLDGHFRHIPRPLQKKVALALAHQGDFDEIGDMIAYLDEETLSQIVDLAIGADDLDFISGHSQQLPRGIQKKLALHLAENGEFDELKSAVQLSFLDGETLDRIVDLAVAAGEIDFLRGRSKQLSQKSQGNIALYLAENEDWSLIEKYVTLAALDQSVLGRLAQLAGEQEEESFLRRLKGLIRHSAPVAPNESRRPETVSAEDAMTRARNGDFRAVPALFDRLSDDERDELIRLAIVYDSTDFLNDLAEDLSAGQLETLCFALARLGEKKRLDPFLTRLTPDKQQRLARILEERG